MSTNPNKETIMVVIEGGIGSGKTYIAEKMIGAIEEVIEREIQEERKGRLSIKIFSEL